jgi:hypothetical protein
MELGVSHFLLPPPFDRLSFFFANLELTVEALDGHQRILYQGLHGDPELALLLARLEGDPFQDLWEFLQDFQGNVPVGR